MKNSTLYIDGHKATVRYDPIIGMMRGVFLNTKGEARFMASDCKELKIAARDALEGYRHDCKRAGIEPFRRKNLLPLVPTLQKLKSLLH
ncbi:MULTISPECIES: hypothetical protein [unclassified Leclercia]|uniref:Uncharacterized protein n=1 Tax=Leclercia barmai TaxID=2785629 RepID=A0ABS7RZ81_9ENTR|nr:MULTISPECIES: hypothetical protein [unclassified Leclercia]MBZ0059582.1 hypothetical protein [Leclercia sp. EMC7]MCM5697286.1 hypothetical protein [Leclercia sp. LTM01]MCM5702119.1 hypothetical protein [Leclercia sp. LTM14]